MKIWLVTRHPGALDWIRQQGVAFDEHLTHIENLADFREGDRVIGSLPVNLVLALNQMGVGYWHIALEVAESLRGCELSCEDMTAAGARLQAVEVTATSLQPPA